MPFGSLVNTGTNISSGGTNAMTTSTAITVTAGNLLVVTSVKRSATAQTVNFSDNLGHTWTVLNQGGGSNITTLGAAWTIVVNTSAALTATSCSSVSAAQGIILSQFTGPFAASPRDVNPTDFNFASVSQSTSPATGVLAQTSELVVSYIGSGNNNVTFTASSPLAQDNQVNLTSGSVTICLAMGSETVSSTLSISPTWSFSAATNGFSGVASFMAGASFTSSNTYFYNDVTTHYGPGSGWYREMVGY